jgi:hypothetical protein
MLILGARIDGQCRPRTQVTRLRAAGNKIRKGRGIKNKVVDVIYRRRPCQPRKLKSAHAFRYGTRCPGFAQMNVSQLTMTAESSPGNRRATLTPSIQSRGTTSGRLVPATYAARVSRAISTACRRGPHARGSEPTGYGSLAPACLTIGRWRMIAGGHRSILSGS